MISRRPRARALGEEIPGNLNPPEVREGFSFYDHRGRRIYKQVIHDGLPPETWFYFYDLQDRLVSEVHVVSENPKAYEYVHLEKIPVFQRATVASGVVDSYLVANHLRLPVVGFGSTGTHTFRSDVDPFGWTQQKEPPYPYGNGTSHMPLRLPGQYEDSETAVRVFDPNTFGNPGVESYLLTYRPPLHYNWHRYYDPLVGRYISTDPSGQHFDINPHRFALHDPVNKYDPKGKVGHVLVGAGAALAEAIGAALTVLAQGGTLLAAGAAAIKAVEALPDEIITTFSTPGEGSGEEVDNPPIPIPLPGGDDMCPCVEKVEPAKGDDWKPINDILDSQPRENTRQRGCPRQILKCQCTCTDGITATWTHHLGVEHAVCPSARTRYEVLAQGGRVPEPPVQPPPPVPPVQHGPYR